ncbi:MAG: hypothetical protein WBI17_14495 [Clostridiaceae bacterium]
MEKNKFLSVSIIILAISITFSSLWIGQSLREAANKNVSVPSEQSNILGLEEAAKYLNLSETEFLYFVEGKSEGLNYIKINDKYIFSKEGLNLWILATSLEVQQ